MAHGGGGAVHLVLSVQSEEDVDRARVRRVRSVVRVVVGVEHVEEVLGVGEPLVGGRGPRPEVPAGVAECGVHCVWLSVDAAWCLLGAVMTASLYVAYGGAREW